MRSVIETLNGAEEAPDYSVSLTAMRWRPERAAASVAAEVVEVALRLHRRRQRCSGLRRAYRVKRGRRW